MNSDIQKAYDLWSGQYDTNDNKTRDLEAMSLRTIFQITKLGLAWKSAVVQERTPSGSHNIVRKSWL